MLKNKSIINLFNNELENSVQTNNDLNILLIFDVVKNDEKIMRRRRQINVLVTSRNENLL